jgi:hypothetical protein
MIPDQSLVSEAHCIADSSETKILCYSIGSKDRWDPEKNSPLILGLSKSRKKYEALWFDPRAGIEKKIGIFDEGQDYTVIPPSNDDWVLLLEAK